MFQMLTFKRIWFVWSRLRSTNTTDKKAAETIKRLNYENKLFFGKLLESRSARRKRLEKSLTKANDNINSVQEIVITNVEVKPRKRIAEGKSTEKAAKVISECFSKTKIEEDVKLIQTIEETGKMPNVIQIPKLQTTTTSSGTQKSNKTSRKKESSACEKVSTNQVKKTVGWVDEAGNQLQIQSGTRIPTLIDVDEKTILGFPLTNMEKEKYITNADNKVPPIKKLIDYHPEYASVSVVLSGSMTEASEANLDRWKSNLVAKLGSDGFKTYSEGQMKFGSCVRSKILDYLTGVPETRLSITSEYENTWKSVKPVFPLLMSTVETEGYVVHKHLKYKGVFDSLSVFRNELMLINWKKSEKFVPSIDRTYDMPLALAAYIGALNFDDRYPFRVEQGLLVLVYTSGQRADVFHLDRDKCLHYWQQWLQRLNTYRLRLIESNVEFVPAVSENVSRLNLKEEARKHIDKQNTSAEVVTDGQVVMKSTFVKIDVEDELLKRKLAAESPRSRPGDGSLIVNEGSILDCPLFNPEKPDYYPPEPLLDVRPSEEFSTCSYPSVTSILSETKSESAKFILERWKRKMIAELGVEGFDHYQKGLLEMGTTMHELIRLRLLGESELFVPDNLTGCWQSLEPVFPLITNVHATESQVVHPLLRYRGIIDCIGQFRNKLVIIDWKRSDKLKTTISMTYDAPLQLAAYVGAVNFDDSYPYKVEEALLVIAYADGQKADLFHLSKEKCWQYWNKWLERVNKYQTMAYEDGSKIKY